MAPIDHRAEVREFLTSRRARITPEQSGLPAYGGNRRVEGLRREEVAMLAGVSVDYYIRMERGNLSGVSGAVLDAPARALQLDDAEQEHLFSLARSAAEGPTRRRTPPASVRPTIQHVLDHRSGRKRLHHPVVGRLDLDYESMELPAEPGLALNVYTAPPGSPTADALAMLASWSAGPSFVDEAADPVVGEKG